MRTLFITIVLGSLLLSQNISPQYGRIDSRKEEAQEVPGSTEMQVLSSSIPLEGPIDPKTYILGPGDKIGIDIISTTHMFFSLAVNPAGDVLIPSVGKIRISGETLDDAIAGITNLIVEQYKNSKVHVSLLDVRSYMVPITGAVLNPGYVQVFSTQRIWNILKDIDGLHPYADDESVIITHQNGMQDIISLRQYLIDGDDKNNPEIQEGDHVHIPFRKDVSAIVVEQTQAVDAVVWITGFVEYPGSYKYIPGYTIQQYIGLAGGALASGSEKSVYVQRNGKIIEDTIIKPGDRIVVPNINEKKDLIWVNGFVTQPKRIPFYTEYSYRDYISAAGGVLNSGAESRTYIIRNGKKISCNKNTIVQPGDRIMVPQNFRDKLLGETNYIQVITAITSLYLAYIAATK